MSKKIRYEKYISDFETTVYEGQTKTEVWASATIPMNRPTHPDNVIITTSIDGFMDNLFSYGKNKKVYFHNLKFDGSFILPWLYESGFEVWSWGDDQDERLIDRPLSEMPTRTFTCLIDDMGQWYSITVHWKHKYVTFVDSLKLLPFSVEAIGEAFETEYRKTSIEYNGKRVPGGKLTDEEITYIKNDVLVLHESLNKLFKMVGEEKMTIGSLCLSEFAKTCFHDVEEMNAILPDLTKVECPIEGFKNADEYIRRSYHGGWCYLKEGHENTSKKPIIIEKGCTADVNSLYPSMLHSDSGSVYPYGKPVWFNGDIPEEVINRSKNGKCYYFVRIKTRFYLKKNHLPTIQIKNNPMYPARKWLTTSDIDSNNIYRDIDGKIQKAVVEMVLTQTDFELIKEHYDLKDLEILDGCYFRVAQGLFDEYINKWSEIKRNSKGAMRTLAKLFLNNLCGKLASSDNSSYKIPFMEDGILKCKIVEDHGKKAGYIAAGSAITSYARNFTIRHAQQNYKHFIYADTDSIHCDCKPRYLKDIKIHPTDFNCWKIENEWDKAVFVRPKTYIEHTVIEDGEKVDPYYLIKCAGMGKNAKKVMKCWLQNGKRVVNHKIEDFDMTDFTIGLTVPNNLKARQIHGGTILVDSDYIMR